MHTAHAQDTSARAIEEKAPGRRLLTSGLPTTLVEFVSTVLKTRGRLSRHERLRDEALSAPRCGRWSTRTVRALLLLLADLSESGWRLSCTRGALWATPPEARSDRGEELAAVKARLRAPLLAARARQLADPAVSAFIRRAQASRTVEGRLVSIADVIDKGPDLARELRRIAALPSDLREPELAKVVRPVVQLVTPDAVCALTGLNLSEIWRYFRHTWSLEYRPTPGRGMQLLIRNSARPGAPVMGIASLASAIPQLRVRDAWIGWTPEQVLRRVSEAPDTWRELRGALLRTVDEARRLVRADDLRRQVGKGRGERVQQELLELAAAAAKERRRRLSRRQRALDLGHAVPPLRRQARRKNGDVDWRAASEDPLFVRKRAKTLADVLFAERVLSRAPDCGAEFVAAALADDGVVRALTIALREVRKVGLASRLLEVNVCGAVPPYRELLGGKLVALLLGSAEVQSQYRARYWAQPSDIASRMAGRPVYRTPSVCVLTTTSLYGVAASQYNRLKLTVPQAARDHTIRWQELGLTEGFGTVHLGTATVDALRALSVSRRGARTVNNVFGEGVSPRLRQVREALDDLGIDSSAVLQHSAARIVYGLELFDGARNDLVLNRAEQHELPCVDAIGRAWRARWLARRIERADVLAAVAAQGPESVRGELVPPPVQMNLF